MVSTKKTFCTRINVLLCKYGPIKYYMFYIDEVLSFKLVNIASRLSIILYGYIIV